MFTPEITSHADYNVPAQSIYIKGHGTYDVRTDTLELVTEHLAHLSVRELRSRMTRAYRSFEGVDPELTGVRRAELLFIAAEYPSMYLPGMVKALGLTVDAEGRYWVPPTPEADQDAEPTPDAPKLPCVECGNSPCVYPCAPAPKCTTCGGQLDPTDEGGFVHADDSDDTHTPTASPFVADPANPTDAELAAAIQRDLAAGRAITWEQFQAKVDAGQADLADVTLFDGYATAPGVEVTPLYATEPSPTMICADCRQDTPRGDVVEVEQPELPGMPLFVCPACAHVRDQVAVVPADASPSARQEFTSPRCAICHRGAHRPGTGYQGHAYSDPREARSLDAVQATRVLTAAGFEFDAAATLIAQAVMFGAFEGSASGRRFHVGRVTTARGTHRFALTAI